MGCYHSTVKDYMDLHLTQHPKYSKPLIFAALPHAVFPVAMHLSYSVIKEMFNKPIVSSMANILSYIPFVRHLALWNGSIPASKQSIFKALTNGYNVNIDVDGIGGMFVDSQHILLKHRKGLAKLALQSGSCIVPIYGFGNSEVYNSHFDSFGIMQRLSRRLKVSLIAFSGRWFTLGPKRVPLYCVFGAVINNPNNGVPIKNPTQIQIDQLHAALLENYKMLFDAHKNLYGWKDRKLVFI